MFVKYANAPPPSVVNITQKMEKCDFSSKHTDSDTVQKIIQTLDTTKETGCDKIPSKILKPDASHLSQHVPYIFNQCIDSC